MEQAAGSLIKLRGRGISWTDVDGDVVALDEEAAIYLAANPAGALLWRALAEGATSESLAALLVDTYGITPAQAQADTEAFLASLDERALLER